LPETIIIHELSDEDLKRESELREIPSPSSNQWQKMEGVFDQSTKIQVIETSYIKEIHISRDIDANKENPEGS
jgi:hypothetical protein